MIKDYKVNYSTYLVRDGKICQMAWNCLKSGKYSATVHLLKQKLWYFQAYNAVTYMLLHLILITTLEGVHYHYPMQFRDEEPEAPRSKGTCSKLLREELTKLRFQFRSSSSTAVLVPWCYIELRASYFLAEVRVFLVVNWLKQNKTNTRAFWIHDQEWFCCISRPTLRNWHRLWFFYLLRGSTNTFSALDFMYLPSLA